MEQNRTSTSEAAGTNSEMASRLRRIRQWRERCQQLVNAVADDALETDSSVAVTEEALTSTLRTRLVEQPGFETQTSNHTLGDDDFAEYGGDENDPSASTSSLNQSRFAHPSRQISVSSSISSIGGQAIHIRRTLHATYRCFRDGSNGVMALNENELVFADWYFHGNRQGELKMCVALLDNDSVETSDGEAENESTVQDRVRIVTLPDNIRHMRAVDMEYAPCKSAYIIGLNQHPSTIENGSALLTSWLYLFDTNEDIFEPWVPLSSPQEDFGLANRICCALEKPVIYVITNNHGASNLLLLNEWGVISGRKEVEDLVPEFENVRFIDVACNRKERSGRNCLQFLNAGVGRLFWSSSVGSKHLGTSQYS